MKTEPKDHIKYYGGLSNPLNSDITIQLTDKQADWAIKETLQLYEELKDTEHKDLALYEYLLKVLTLYRDAKDRDGQQA